MIASSGAHNHIQPWFHLGVWHTSFKFAVFGHPLVTKQPAFKRSWRVALLNHGYRTRRPVG